MMTGSSSSSSIMFSGGVSGHVAGDRASRGAYRGPKLETRYRSKNLVGENLLLDPARWPLITQGHTRDVCLGLVFRRGWLRFRICLPFHARYMGCITYPATRSLCRGSDLVEWFP